MDVYEKAILLAAAPTFAALGWHWKPVRWLMPLVALLALWAISMYAGQLDMGNKKFWLRNTAVEPVGDPVDERAVLPVDRVLLDRPGCRVRTPAASIGSKLCWAAVVLGLTGMMVRWYESYLIGADVGHIPVSNLYEVFVLFSLITAMFYLYYEQHYRPASWARSCCW